MEHLSWLTQEARTLHGIFSSLFYSLVLTFLAIGVVLEYFKAPLGQIPSFPILVGRAMVASLMLQAYPMISNHLGDITDALANRLGDLNNIDMVVAKMGDKLDTMSSSWISVKETITLAISFISFLLLYFSTFVAEGIFLFTWTLLYVFSPLLIAMFVLPSTATATTALFRSLFEVSCWKIVWSVLATLLWSMALSDLNQPETAVNFVSVVCLNLVLASSLLLTPWIVHALTGAGLSGYTRTLGSVAIGAATLSPGKIIDGTKAVTTSSIQRATKAGKTLKDYYNKEVMAAKFRPAWRKNKTLNSPKVNPSSTDPSD